MYTSTDSSIDKTKLENKLKYLNFLFIVLLFNSCKEQNINTLKVKNVKFTDLPVEITQYLRNPTDVQNDISTMLLELPKEKENEYKLETVKTWIGPWVSHEKLINIKNNTIYKINQGVPSPYIIFENKLYIPNGYNILTTVDDLNSVEFTRYELK
ncbi:hypothetical protein Y10_24710 [Neptunitalea sp. Y10]|uniref:Lipoprotein n=1 Tax=Neptunitalea lumnitzerae TaxID=2965509 RepID=A0ABQ5ML51_9FLAO|nr:hypothetical protein Y10_24710 [Neptunitalea sp. Y10]